jgi:hypothetical protein
LARRRGVNDAAGHTPNGEQGMGVPPQPALSEPTA